MAQRIEPPHSLDDFPTPPWATRALIELILTQHSLHDLTCLEPACGAGHMAKALQEYFRKVISSDIYDYGFGRQSDFLADNLIKEQINWIITNPPFRLAEEFALKALQIASTGVAIFARTVFIESIGRYENLFRQFPPTIVAQFTERVPLIKGRLDRKATTATGYCWLVWKKEVEKKSPELLWIPPCRRQLERSSDYE